MGEVTSATASAAPSSGPSLSQPGKELSGGVGRLRGHKYMLSQGPRAALPTTRRGLLAPGL